MGLDGRTLVTKNSFRFLNTLYTMGPSPEPNMTILWSEKLPLNFKKFAAKAAKSRRPSRCKPRHQAYERRYAADTGRNGKVSKNQEEKE